MTVDLLQEHPLPDPPRAPVRLGAVGLGFIFQHAHGPALRFLQARGWPVELVAVCDVNPEVLTRATTAWPGARVYPTAAALLAGKPLDGILFNTWPPLSIELYQQALGRVPGIFVEKPVADNADAIRQLMELADQATGTRLQVGYNRRHMPCAVAFRQALQAADVSRKVTVRFLRKKRSEPHFYEDTLGHPLDFLRSCFHNVRIIDAEAEPLQPGQHLRSVVRATGFCDAYPFTLESRPAAGCNLEEYTVRGAATNLCVQHPPGATAASERNATIYAQGMVHQLASFVRLACGAETISSCTLADALAARRLVDASLAK